MKDLITTIASLIILMSYLTVFVSNQLAFRNVMVVEYYAREIESNEISAEDAVSGISKAIGCEKDELNLSESSDGKNLSIKIPLKYVLGSAIINLDSEFKDSRQCITRQITKDISETASPENERNNGENDEQ